MRTGIPDIDSKRLANASTSGFPSAVPAWTATTRASGMRACANAAATSAWRSLVAHILKKVFQPARLRALSVEHWVTCASPGRRSRGGPPAGGEGPRRFARAAVLVTDDRDHRGIGDQLAGRIDRGGFVLEVVDRLHIDVDTPLEQLLG